MKKLFSSFIVLLLLSQLGFSQSVSEELTNALKLDDVLLFEKAADMEQKNECFQIRNSMYNYLTISIKVEAASITKYLIESGVDLNIVCSDKTALMYAVKYNQIESLKALVEAGADTSILNDGKSVFDYANKYEHNQIQDYLKTIEE